MARGGERRTEIEHDIDNESLQEKKRFLFLAWL
jgi:hypothetical protein